MGSWCSTARGPSTTQPWNHGLIVAFKDCSSELLRAIRRLLTHYFEGVVFRAPPVVSYDSSGSCEARAISREDGSGSSSPMGTVENRLSAEATVLKPG